MYTSIITTSELAEQLSDTDCVIVDCRFSLEDPAAGRQEYLKAHIPRAIYAHLDDDLSGPIIPGKTGRHPLPSIEKASSLFGLWGIAEDVQVVAYDQGHGGIAARLWWMLRWLGHEAVAVLDGGWKAWREEGREESEEIHLPLPVNFKVNVQKEAMADKRMVFNNLKTNKYRLIDARIASRYRGEEEPIDPVAGHIPGAINLPFTENLGENGRFLSKAALKQRFDEELKGNAAAPAVVYCGSGVTACHNILAMHHAGIKPPKLYPGSWSEWITDASYPVEKP